MESQLVPQHGVPLEMIDFGGLRGKGPGTALLPLRLLKAFWQSIGVLRRVKPDVVVGLGGYITFPAGMMAVLMGKSLLLHEQNSVAGLANRVLAGVADRVFTAFPDVLRGARWVGNPLRDAFLRVPTRATFCQPQRTVARAGRRRQPGRRVLNEVVPQALALLPPQQRPQVLHQSGTKQIDALRMHYAAAGVAADLTPFIDNTAQAFAMADLVICRAGASTVSESPRSVLPRCLCRFRLPWTTTRPPMRGSWSDQNAGWLLPQAELTPETG
jgi:UDP-N-acetylglucosamine--N-acetylmuramyl-(pentapeptide) pyrophosphoryl-undecaprenol N-acetylglucosamine transferase